VSDRIEHGRAAFARRAWDDAFNLLAEASDAADLERLAVAADLTGRDDASVDAWERAHRAWIDGGDTDRAALAAARLSMGLLLRGQEGPSSGWQARAARLIAESGHECAASGLALLPSFLHALMSDPAGAETIAARILEIGQCCGDPDVVAFGLLGSGQAALAQGDTEAGLRFLDEVMVDVTSGELSPLTSGLVYCAVIESCVDVFDFRRAAEWTESLHRWCESQPDLVPYRGQCMVHRAEVFQSRGEWAAALEEANSACTRLGDPPHPALGVAYFRQGELHRLRGKTEAARRSYLAAGRYGHEPGPGIALLHLAEGEIQLAVAVAKRLLGVPGDIMQNPAPRLAVAAEVLLAAGDNDAARPAVDELGRIADSLGTTAIQATALHASGSLLLADGDAAAALLAFRQAGQRWRELGMPYELARAQVGAGAAYRRLGDHGTAAIELDAARTVFDRLGARVDLASVEALAERSPNGHVEVLTAREREVLRLLATGRTNRQLAADLGISEHTVARHVQNIFLKLDLPSRAAATAYAYEHGMV
jgi:DNA-binding CsgD family transcriptional regulator/tetratricopeptide (TPR) repeat protein